jgi:hypothetical protein
VLGMCWHWADIVCEDALGLVSIILHEASDVGRNGLVPVLCQYSDRLISRTSHIPFRLLGLVLLMDALWVGHDSVLE